MESKAPVSPASSVSPLAARLAHIKKRSEEERAPAPSQSTAPQKKPTPLVSPLAARLAHIKKNKEEEVPPPSEPAPKPSKVKPLKERMLEKGKQAAAQAKPVTQVPSKPQQPKQESEKEAYQPVSNMERIGMGKNPKHIVANGDGPDGIKWEVAEWEYFQDKPDVGSDAPFPAWLDANNRYREHPDTKKWPNRRTGGIVRISTPENPSYDGFTISSRNKEFIVTGIKKRTAMYGKPMQIEDTPDAEPMYYTGDSDKKNPRWETAEQIEERLEKEDRENEGKSQTIAEARDNRMEAEKRLKETKVRFEAIGLGMKYAGAPPAEREAALKAARQAFEKSKKDKQEKEKLRKVEEAMKFGSVSPEERKGITKAATQALTDASEEFRKAKEVERKEKLKLRGPKREAYARFTSLDKLKSWLARLGLGFTAVDEITKAWQSGDFKPDTGPSVKTPESIEGKRLHRWKGKALEPQGLEVGQPKRSRAAIISIRNALREQAAAKAGRKPQHSNEPYGLTPGAPPRSESAIELIRNRLRNSGKTPQPSPNPPKTDQGSVPTPQPTQTPSKPQNQPTSVPGGSKWTGERKGKLTPQQQKLVTNNQALVTSMVKKAVSKGFVKDQDFGDASSELAVAMSFAAMDWDEEKQQFWYERLKENAEKAGPKAVAKFEKRVKKAGMDVGFGSYAAQRMRARLREFGRQGLKVGKQKRAQVREYHQAVQAFQNKLDRLPTDEELQQQLGWTPRILQSVKKAAKTGLTQESAGEGEEDRGIKLSQIEGREKEPGTEDVENLSTSIEPILEGWEQDSENPYKKRWAQFMRMAMEGKNNQDIANQFNITRHAVKLGMDKATAALKKEVGEGEKGLLAWLTKNLVTANQLLV